MRLVLEIQGYTADVVRVDPSDEHVPDPLFWQDRDESVWLVETAMEDRTSRRLKSVRRSLYEWMRDANPTHNRRRWQALAELYVASALHHPDTPFGLFYKSKWDPEQFGTYRGEWWNRDRRGALIAWGQRDELAQTRQEWVENFRRAQAWLEARP